MGAIDAHASLPKPVIENQPTARRKDKQKGAKKAKLKKNAKAAATGTPSRSAGRIGKLVIVESPAKARSVTHYLGKGYTVKASKGHVRDLLVSQLSVDVENQFEPKYRVLNDKRNVVKELKSAVDAADEVYLATDPDREGEAIAWHLIAATEAQPRKLKRVTFNEITPQAVHEAFLHARGIDMDLVNAQQARRILDRLVGYNISQLLWEKVRNRLSAGRVQSIAVRLIVDREREIEAFVPHEYWTLDARLRKQQVKQKVDARPFLARLVRIHGQDAEFGSEGDVQPHLAVLQRSQYTVTDVKHGERVRKPSGPFTTSTLQQEASRRLGFNAKRTMTIAQQLYEGIDLGKEGATGLITYMRTDSMNVSPQAQTEAHEYIAGRFGKEFVPPSPPVYKTRAKNAQEAHEAIRPTKLARTPESIKSHLTSEQFRLYTLVWQRFVASQMASAIYNTMRVEIAAGDGGSTPYLFRVSGSTIKFSGFLILYEDARDEDATVDEDEGRVLPEMTANELLALLELLPEQHFTQPPPRYTEASLVRTLEEYGIGRPSTFAPTVSIIQDREYVQKLDKDKRLVPTETGKIVNDLLVTYFPDIMDYQFTARMEDQLDDIADGHIEWRPMLGEFYAPFQERLNVAREAAPSIKEEEETGQACPVCGSPLVIRYGRFGKFIGCSKYPECTHTEPWLERMGIACPECGEQHGGELVVRRSKRGRTFYGCSRYPDCPFTHWKRPLAQPCANCGGLLVEQNRTTAQCIRCGHSQRIEPVAELSAERA
jgi:DNA topoisomerase-1